MLCTNRVKSDYRAYLKSQGNETGTGQEHCFMGQEWKSIYTECNPSHSWVSGPARFSLFFTSDFGQGKKAVRTALKGAANSFAAVAQRESHLSVVDAFVFRHQQVPSPSRTAVTVGTPPVYQTRSCFLLSILASKVLFSPVLTNVVLHQSERSQDETFCQCIGWFFCIRQSDFQWNSLMQTSQNALMNMQIPHLFT